MFKLLSLHLCSNKDFSFNVYRAFGHILLNTVTIRVVFIILQVVFSTVNKIASNATENPKFSKRISTLLLLYFPDETSKSCQQWEKIFKIICTFKFIKCQVVPQLLYRTCCITNVSCFFLISDNSVLSEFKHLCMIIQHTKIHSTKN